MVGVRKMRIFVRVGGQYSPGRFDGRPPVRGHQGPQPQPSGLAAGLVETKPAALEEDDPARAAAVAADVVSRGGAVVARDVAVVQELAR